MKTHVLVNGIAVETELMGTNNHQLVKVGQALRICEARSYGGPAYYDAILLGAEAFPKGGTCLVVGIVKLSNGFGEAPFSVRRITPEEKNFEISISATAFSPVVIETALMSIDAEIAKLQAAIMHQQTMKDFLNHRIREIMANAPLTIEAPAEAPAETREITDGTDQ